MRVWIRLGIDAVVVVRIQNNGAHGVGQAHAAIDEILIAVFLTRCEPRKFYPPCLIVGGKVHMIIGRLF